MSSNTAVYQVYFKAVLFSETKEIVPKQSMLNRTFPLSKKNVFKNYSLKGCYTF